MDVARSRWTGSGWSNTPDLDSPTTMVLLFGGHSLIEDPEPIDAICAAFANSIVIGCSSSGQIAGPELLDVPCVAAVARFDTVRLRKAAADVGDVAESFIAGAAIGAELAADDLRSIFVLSDGLGVNGSDLVAGLRARVDESVVITGGLAGDDDRFEQTWVIDDGQIRSDRVVAIGLYGDTLRVGSGSAGGWGIFGPERVVTRSEKNVLFELDGQPALEIYKRYLGDLAVGLPASALLFPLSIRDGEDGEPLVRTILAVNEHDQSMTFAGDIPVGWRAQLMRSSVDRLVDGAATAAAMTADGLGPVAGPALNIAISCVGRRLVLGERVEEELEATLDALGSNSELVGFYSYGEIAPGSSGCADLHNQTMTVTTLSEARA